VRRSAPPPDPDVRISISEAFQRLLRHYEGAGHLAGNRFDEVLQIGGGAPGGVQLWVGDTAVNPDWYAGHMRVAVKVADDQWNAELEPNGARPVEPGPYLWNVSAANIDALIKLEQEATITLDKLEQESKIIKEALITLGRLEQESKITKETLDTLKQGLERELKVTKGALDKLKQGKRGPKPYDWELFKAKFYLLLDDDDVPAHNDINVQHYADQLMTWGRNNFSEKATPEQASMRAKVAEWKPLWQRLKGANK
jgi:hypothetical protein